MQCVTCNSLDIHVFKRFEILKRVTSDAKPWPAGGTLTICRQCATIQKVADHVWLNEIGAIYNNYEVYHQSNGEEQAIFDPRGVPSKRSSILTKFIQESQLIDKKPQKILDYGCGNGEFLSSFGKAYSTWELFGLDLSRKHAIQLEGIQNFKQLYQPSDPVKRQFKLVTLIHALEHLTTPVKTLKEIKNYLQDDGFLFIQVPNIEMSPFDILVADHLLHFSADTLNSLLSTAGFDIIHVSTETVTKEISLLAKPHSQKCLLTTNKPDLSTSINRIEKYIDFNLQIVEDVKKLQLKNSFAIFGTSISATWLYGYFPTVACFVDEDPNRIGKTHFGKPIFSPQSIYDTEISVYVPLVPSIATQVVNRHLSYNKNFISPTTHQGNYL